MDYKNLNAEHIQCVDKVLEVFKSSKVFKVNVHQTSKDEEKKIAYSKALVIIKKKKGNLGLSLTFSIKNANYLKISYCFVDDNMILPIRGKSFTSNLKLKRIESYINESLEPVDKNRLEHIQKILDSFKTIMLSRTTVEELRGLLIYNVLGSSLVNKEASTEKKNASIYSLLSVYNDLMLEDNPGEYIKDMETLITIVMQKLSKDRELSTIKSKLAAMINNMEAIAGFIPINVNLRNEITRVGVGKIESLLKVL